MCVYGWYSFKSNNKNNPIKMNDDQGHGHLIFTIFEYIFNGITLISLMIQIYKLPIQKYTSVQPRPAFKG